METFSVLLALCEGNPPVTGGFPSQRPVTRSFEVFFDVRPNKRLRKQSRLHGANYGVTVMVIVCNFTIFFHGDEVMRVCRRESCFVTVYELLSMTHSRVRTKLKRFNLLTHQKYHATVIKGE